MKCFYHPESDAVGVCHCCQRGLCPQCAQEAAKAIACKGRCEQDVLALEELTLTRERLKRDMRERLILAKVFILIGVLVLEWSGMGMLILRKSYGFIPFIGPECDVFIPRYPDVFCTA